MELLNSLRRDRSWNDMWGSTICHLNSSWCFFCHIQAIATESPSDISWGGKCVLLCCVGSWSSHQLTRRGKRDLTSEGICLGLRCFSGNLIPWPYSILPISPTWYVSFWILRARLVWAENKKGLFNYPKWNLDLSGWLFFTQPTWQRWWVVSANPWETILLEPFFAWHFFCTVAKNRMRLAETSSRVFWRNQCLWCLTVDGEDVWCIPKHGVSRSCIRSFIGTSARTGNFYFRMGAAIPSSSAVLWGHGFSFLGLTPQQKASALLMKDVNRTRIDTHTLMSEVGNFDSTQLDY